jgi:hypothetical protein
VPQHGQREPEQSHFQGESERQPDFQRNFERQSHFQSKSERLGQNLERQQQAVRAQGVLAGLEASLRTSRLSVNDRIRSDELRLSRVGSERATEVNVASQSGDDLERQDQTVAS